MFVVSAFDQHLGILRYHTKLSACIPVFVMTVIKLRDAFSRLNEFLAKDGLENEYGRYFHTDMRRYIFP